MPDETQHSRLPRNFHKTFKPERQYINAMLRYAASGEKGDYRAIAAATGIPTGTSSGKVPAILDYCRGMGLIRLAGQERSSTKKPELTPLGRIVLLEDPYLKTRVSQWIAHFNLCSPTVGADVWYHIFFAGMQALGMNFARAKLETYLNVIYGVERSGLIGPLIGTYEDDAAFKMCGVLSEIGGTVVRRPAPIADELGLGYGAWMLQLMRDHFPKRRQVPITDLDATAGWRTIPGWDISSLQRALELVERKGLIEVDRHMEPWLLIPKADADETWRHIYDDML
ncbi:conserved hypothetical protein [uncultured Desulfobacterium sp.]|uniref:DUF4007 domain-containing protein n=1 Tax=uncultured Desulfobacterium sp. TaxID=201089 RepID=A0A445N119_9BACT|nr:conserved hypothetical protein [uncultured Desulfobacterium sp.]